MLRYTLKYFFPEAATLATGPGGLAAATLAMYAEVVKRTAELVAAWQVHTAARVYRCLHKHNSTHVT